MSAPAFEAFQAAFLAGDGDALARTFTPDGSYATNAGYLLQGRDQIRSGAAEWFSRRPSNAVVELDIRLLRSGKSGTMRWELLEYHQHGSVPGRAAAGTVDEAGHAVAVYQRADDGTSLITSLVVSLRPSLPR